MMENLVQNRTIDVYGLNRTAALRAVTHKLIVTCTAARPRTTRDASD